MPPDDFSKSLGVNVKANFDASGFEKGSDRVIASAERQATALQDLRKSTEQLQQLQQAYTRTPDVYSQERQQYIGRGKSIFSAEAEKLRLKSLEYEIKAAGGTTPEIGGVSIQEEFEPRELSTRRLRSLVEERFSQSGGMSKTQRSALLGDTRPQVSELQRRYGSTQQYYASKVREATAEFESLSSPEQSKNLDAFTQKIQMFEESGRKARIASDELSKSTKKLSEEAGLASKSLPAYAASVINMGVTIGQGIAQISRAGALAFDYSSPMGMYSAQTQFEIQKSKTLWNTGGQVVGQIGGAIFGGMTGFNPFASSYIGGMIGGGAGDIISTFLNIEPEKRLKFIGQMYGKSSEAVNRLAGVQGQEYGLARRTGASPEQIAIVLRKYASFGIDQNQAAEIANQYVNSTGSMSTSGLDQWLNLYQRTGIMPGGMLEKLSGGNSANLIAGIGTKMGLSRPRYADLSQYIQQATNVAGRLFTSPSDIERSTSMMAELPFTLYGESVKNNKWATSFEGMQQIGQGFQALGQSKNAGEQAFLFNALNKSGASWRDTLLRMNEGIYGKGNLGDILSYTKKAYGGRGGDALFSMLSDKGVNPSVIRELVKQFESDSSGLIDRIGGEDITEKNIYKKLGLPLTSPLAKIKAGESISVTESARGMAESFATGLATFNIKVAELAASPETQKRVQEMYAKVITSVEDAFKLPITGEGKEIVSSLEKTGRTPSGKSRNQLAFGVFGSLLDLIQGVHGEETTSVMTADNKKLTFQVDTRLKLVNSTPQSNNRSTVPTQR